MAHNPDGLFLVSDSGGTHTRALVATAAGKILGTGSSGGGNAFAVGKRAASENLRRTLRMAMQDAGVRASRLSSIVIGTASVTSDGKNAAPIEAELRAFLRNDYVRVVGDARIALEGALAGEPGVVTVAGTGSIVLGRNVCGTFVRVGGWGPLAGDEGSAQWLGRRALQEAANCADQVSPHSLLLDLICSHFYLQRFDDVLDIIYDHPMTSAEIGALAPLVTEAAEKGDRTAQELLRCGSSVLALQVATAARRLKMKAPLVSHQGSMFNVRRFRASFSKELQRLLPQARFTTPRLPPIGGAFLLALGDAKIKPSPSVIHTFLENGHA